ncbi:hypothetical protein EI94DRAFT_197469 [Lactarius quietus]|nr:hypothetical protein EI94DRAFT_197469 [Lactarius quietus]
MSFLSHRTHGDVDHEFTVPPSPGLSYIPLVLQCMIRQTTQLSCKSFPATRLRPLASEPEDKILEYGNLEAISDAISSVRLREHPDEPPPILARDPVRCSQITIRHARSELPALPSSHRRLSPSRQVVPAGGLNARGCENQVFGKNGGVRRGKEQSLV